MSKKYHRIFLHQDFLFIHTATGTFSSFITTATILKILLFWQIKFSNFLLIDSTILISQDYFCLLSLQSQTLLLFRHICWFYKNIGTWIRINIVHATKIACEDLHDFTCKCLTLNVPNGRSYPPLLNSVNRNLQNSVFTYPWFSKLSKSRLAVPMIDFSVVTIDFSGKLYENKWI